MTQIGVELDHELAGNAGEGVVNIRLETQFAFRIVLNQTFKLADVATFKPAATSLLSFCNVSSIFNQMLFPGIDALASKDRFATNEDERSSGEMRLLVTLRQSVGSSSERRELDLRPTTSIVWPVSHQIHPSGIES